MSSQVCHDFGTAKGCKRTNCRFLHQKDDQTRSNQAKPPVTAASGSRHKPSTTSTTGRRTDTNRKQPQTSKSPSAQPTPTSTSARGAPAGRGHGRGRGRGGSRPPVNGSRGSSAQMTISTVTSPSSALHHLKDLCNPRVDFVHPNQILGFVNLLINASSKQNSWVRIFAFGTSTR